MDRKFIIERQDKPFVLYSGLLDLAHQKGLSGIMTTLEQFPTEENGRTCIFSAVVTLLVDGEQKIFKSYGDANPGNVPANILPSFIRMAETRAIGRALRNAVNIGMVCSDEMADEGENVRPQRQQRQQTDYRGNYSPKSQAAPEAGSYAAKTEDKSDSVTDPNKINEGQVNAITRLSATLGTKPPADMLRMSRYEAADEIKALNIKIENQKRGVAA